MVHVGKAQNDHLENITNHHIKPCIHDHFLGEHQRLISLFNENQVVSTKNTVFFYGHFQVHENYKISSCIWQPIRSQLSSATPLYGNIKCGWRVPRVKPSAEAEHEGNGRVLATYLQNYEVIWLKVKMALYSNAGTLFESTRVPSTLGGQGII